MSRDRLEKKFKDLMQSYESGEVDWDDVRVPDFDENEDEVLDLNINTEVDLENSFDKKRDSSTKFHELKENFESSSDPYFRDESKTNSFEENSDPFIYLDKDDLEIPEEKDQKTDSVDCDYNKTLLLNSSLSRYPTEYIIMEWLQYLVDQSTVTDAYIALNYYHKIRWLSQEEKEDIQKYLYGFNGQIDKNRASNLHTCSLTNDNHRDSLKYINRLRSDLTEGHI
jgi:archaellum component FlaD/FlaE